MDVNELTEAFFKSEFIEFYRSCEITSDFIISPRRLPEWAKYVTAFIIPYREKEKLSDRRNVSLYAVSRDYHLYVSALSDRFETAIKNSGLSFKQKIFADTSPFNERALARSLELGFIGKNGLLINEKYGSFIFIGELVTDAQISICSLSEPKLRRKSCFDCGKCSKACPAKCFSEGGSECFSAVTQKKKINDDDKNIIEKHYLAWGCDICQEVCPHNASAEDTPIKFFRESRISFITSEMIENMPDGIFSERSYSWRGKDTLIRNLKLQEDYIKKQ